MRPKPWRIWASNTTPTSCQSETGSGGALSGGHRIVRQLQQLGLGDVAHQVERAGMFSARARRSASV